MAQQKLINAQKQEIVNRLANSRLVITHERATLKEKLSPKKQIQGLLKKQPKKVMLGSAVAGLVAVLILKPKSKKKKATRKRRGVIMTLAGWSFALAKPTIKKWAIKQVTSAAKQKLSNRYQ